jgi:HEAT repeat protein
MEISRAESARNAEIIVESLEVKDSRVREAAAKALGRMGDPRAVDPLVNALGDPQSGVRDAAAVALKNLNEPLGDRISESLWGD